MEGSNCKHLRIRNEGSRNLEVEQFIKCIEKEYKIDFTSLPQWKEFVKRLHVTTTDYKRKMQDAKLRKTLIMKKIYTELFRPTPFELTNHFARTAGKWEIKSLKSKRTKPIVLLKPVNKNDSFSESQSPINNEANEEKIVYIVAAVPPNTEIDHMERFKNSTAKPSPDLLLNTLPSYFCRNKHKMVSPLESNDSNLISIPSPGEFKRKAAVIKYRLPFQETSSIVSTPKEINITSNQLNKQTIKFSLINNSPMKHILYIRFICITDICAFRKATILPATPLKLYPGIKLGYRFVFELVQSKNEFESQIYFKVRNKIYNGEPAKAFYIPIVRKAKVRSVLVTETVTIPPIYLWHFETKAEHPKGIAEVSVTDNRFYHMHIVKRAVDLAKGTTKITDAYTDRVLQKALERIETKKRLMQSESSIRRKQLSEKLKSMPKDSRSDNTTCNIFKFNDPPYENIDVIILVIEDVIRLCIDTFKFDPVYKFLGPDSKIKIPVYLTEMEHIGYHNYYYDFEFYDPETNDCVMIKTVKVFAEILPHPIKIKPELLLDMSNSKTSHGFCKDTFTILNTLKCCPVSIKIQLSKKTKKLLNITPMETYIPNLSNVTFHVNFCGRDQITEAEQLVHLSLKIIVTGNQSVYLRIPPIDYEIVAPCVNVFKSF